MGLDKQRRVRVLVVFGAAPRARGAVVSGEVAHVGLLDRTLAQVHVTWGQQKFARVLQGVRFE